MRTTRPRAGALLAGIAALVLTAGCGTATQDPPGSGASPAPTAPVPGQDRVSPVPPDANYNAADVVFAQEMLLHAKQAVEMAALAKTRAADAKVKQLATNAQQDREPVVTILAKWLADHRQPAPSAPITAGQRGGASGIADEQEMTTLAGVEGTPFDRLFLQMLIINNEAATNLLNGEQWSGKAPALISLAHDLAASHQAEQGKARQLLGR